MIQIDDVRQLASLARLSMTEEQLQAYQKDFEGILNYIETINQADVAEVELPYVLTNVVRDDEEAYEAGEFTNDLIGQAPQSKDAYFEVPKIL
jgi:aspartyl-tRNA(Asn)/glutamyl-tRNA(Gln) amidotransferase subunit C